MLNFQGRLSCVVVRYFLTGTRPKTFFPDIMFKLAKMYVRVFHIGITYVLTYSEPYYRISCFNFRFWRLSVFDIIRLEDMNISQESKYGPHNSQHCDLSNQQSLRFNFSLALPESASLKIILMSKPYLYTIANIYV